MNAMTIDNDPRDLSDGQIATKDAASAMCGGKRVAVSITPLALEADSRTFKIAMSLRRFGYHSIVLEGSLSTEDFTPHGLDVRSLGPQRPASPSPRGGAQTPHSSSQGTFGHLIRLVAFYGIFLRRYMLAPFLRLPRADLYYVHSYEYLPLALVRRRGARVIYDAHDFYQDILPKEAQSDLVRLYLLPAMGRIEKAAARRCDVVVTVSPSVAAALEESIGVKPVVLVNSVDRRTNRASERGIRATLGLESKDCLLVMVSNRKAGYSFDFVTAMLRHLPRHVHVAFLGRGYEADEENRWQAGVDGRLHFIPAVPAVQVSSFIAGADAGLLLYRPISRNYRGALPNGLFHAIDAGLPLARFALPEVEAVIGGAAVGPVLDADDPAQAAMQLAAFLGDPEKRLASAAAAAALGGAVTWTAQEHILRAACAGKPIDPIAASTY